MTASPSSPTPNGPEPVTGSAVARLGLVAALAVLAWHVAHTRFLIDDAFISFRYASRWASGLGLTFNPGEPPVEGYSNFLWVVWLAAGARLGVAPETVALATSVVAATATLVVLHRTLERWGATPPITALATVFLAAFPPFATWATGGLETALFGFLIVFGSTHLFDERERNPLPTALVATGLVLTRTDGFAFALATGFLALVFGAPRTRARARLFLVVALIAFGIHLGWRRLHYGEWVANTVRAKAETSAAVWLRGGKTTLSYLLLFLAPCIAPLALLARSALTPRGAVSSTVLLLLAFVAFNTLVGGDWMPMFRFLAPASGLLAIALAALAMRLGTTAGSVLLLAALTVSLPPTFGRSLVPRSTLAPLDFRGFRTGYKTERERWQIARRNVANFEQIGRGLAEHADPQHSITLGAIGAIGYRSGLRVFDRNGLVDPDVARRTADPEGRSAGHDKRVPRAYFLDRTPTYFEALIAPGRFSGPESPRFAQAARSLATSVFRDPQEAALREHCLPRAWPLGPASKASGEEFTLVVLEYTNDRERAAAFWRSLGN